MTQTTNGNNQLVGFGYDNSGNMLTEGSTTYGWNGENWLTSFGSVSYSYDGNGLRVKKSTGTLYWRSVAGNVLAETDLSGNTTAEYITFAGRQVARRDSTGNVFYYFADHLGSSRVITQATGTVCYDADFLPFGGERTPVVNTCPQAYKFTGYERDSDSGLDYATFRYYNSRLGRFMSGDPLAGNTENPQSLNRYAYVLNNPVRLVDALGLGVGDCEFVVRHGTKEGGYWYEGYLCGFGQNVAVDKGTGGSEGGGRKAPLSPKDQKRHQKLLEEALKDIWNARCIAFCILQGIDPLQFYTTIQNQQAYNGSQSTITTAAAHTGFPNGAQTVAQGFKEPGVQAAASTNSYDVYFRQGGFLSSIFGNGSITEATIEHEALHNMTGAGDTTVGNTQGVEEMLGLPPNASNTDEINQALKDNGCSH